MHNEGPNDSIKYSKDKCRAETCSGRLQVTLVHEEYSDRLQGIQLSKAPSGKFPIPSLNARTASASLKKELHSITQSEAELITSQYEVSSAHSGNFGHNLENINRKMERATYTYPKPTSHNESAYDDPWNLESVP